MYTTNFTTLKVFKFVPNVMKPFSLLCSPTANKTYKGKKKLIHKWKLTVIQCMAIWFEKKKHEKTFRIIIWDA